MKAAANFRFYQRLIFPEGWRCDYSLSSDLFFLLRSTSPEKYQLQQIWLLMLHFFFFFFFLGEATVKPVMDVAPTQPRSRKAAPTNVWHSARWELAEKNTLTAAATKVFSKRNKGSAMRENVPHDQIQSRLTCGSLSRRGPAAGPSNSLKRPRSNHAPSGIGRAEAADWMRSYNHDRFGDKCSFSSVRGKLRRISISCRS